MFQTMKFLKSRWEDADELTAFINAYGYQIKKPTVYQWFLRKRIPAEWAFLLIALLELDSGKPVSLAKFFK